MNTIHSFKVDSIEGSEIDFARFKGKKMMIINVASACGYTPQYQQLQELYEEHGDKLAVIGFPANNFGGQEPGSNDEIKEFCSLRFGVTFPLAAKIDINTHPVYQWLTLKAQNGKMDTEVSWNFQKYLLDEHGQLAHCLSSSTSPFDDVIMDWVNS